MNSPKFPMQSPHSTNTSNIQELLFDRTEDDSADLTTAEEFEVFHAEQHDAEKEAKENAEEKKLWSLIHQYIISDDSLNLQKFLVENPTAVQVCDSQGNNALHAAALLKRPKIIKMYKKLPKLLNATTMLAPSETRFTPTEICVENEVEGMFIQNIGVQDLYAKFSADEIRWAAYSQIDNNSSNLLLMENNDHFTPAHLAIKQNDLETLKLLVEPHSLKYASCSVGTVLTFAVDLGYFEITRYLLNIGADPNLADLYKDRTPFLIATQCRNLKICRLLIRAGAKTGNCLTRAIISNDNDLVNFLIDELNVPLVNEESDFLSLACIHGRVEMLNKLIEFGAPLTSTNCLLIAVQSANAQMCKLLLNAGATLTMLSSSSSEGILNVNDKVLEEFAFDSTPFEIAVSKGHLEIVKLLVEYSDSMMVHDYRCVSLYTILMVAVQSRQLHVARYLIEIVKVDIETQNAAGHTALMIAVLTEFPEMVDLLLKNGAKTEKLSASRLTALTLAVMQGNLTIVSLLVEAGAQVCYADDERETPLMIASMKSSCLPIVQYLLETKKCSIQDITNSIIRACKADVDINLIKLLLKQENVDLTRVIPKQIHSPFEVALSTNRSDIVREMLTYRPRLDVAMSIGLYPMAVATERFFEVDIIETMLNQGADPCTSSVNPANNNPVMYYAVGNGAFDVIKLLTPCTPIEKLLPCADALIRLAAKHSSEILHYILDMFPNIKKHSLNTSVEMFRNIGRTNDFQLLIEMLEAGVPANPAPYVVSAETQQDILDFCANLNEYEITLIDGKNSKEFVLVPYSYENMMDLLHNAVEAPKGVHYDFEYCLNNEFFLLQKELGLVSILNVMKLKVIHPTHYTKRKIQKFFDVVIETIEEEKEEEEQEAKALK